jgi:ABC-2 type transport system permease protein
MTATSTAPTAPTAPTTESHSALRTYVRLVGARVRSDWQYRASFVMFLAAQTLVSGADLGVVLVLFSQVSALAGWTRPQVVVLYCLSGISFGLADLFVSQVETASTHIKAGTFDQFLIRPVGVLWQLSAHEFAPRRIGRTVLPLIFLPIVLAQCDVQWTAAKVVLIPVTLVAGFFIWGAVWVATSSISFWTVDSREIANSFTYGGNLLTQYPLDVMAPWLQHIATFIVPLAFVAYFPAAYLLDKDQPAGLPSWLAFATPLVAGVSVVVARAVWRQAIRHYRSTGS